MSLNIAACIEHTNLSPSLTIRDIDQLVDEARQYGFLGVCVPPFWVKRAQRESERTALRWLLLPDFRWATT
jgi:deoxyribose-phosphate aldolase